MGEGNQKSKLKGTPSRKLKNLTVKMFEICVAARPSVWQQIQTPPAFYKISEAGFINVGMSFVASELRQQAEGYE